MTRLAGAGISQYSRHAASGRRISFAERTPPRNKGNTRPKPLIGGLGCKKP